MSVEIEKHSIVGKRGKYHGTESVSPGHCETTHFLKVGEVLIIASSLKKEAAIFVKGEGISAEKYTLPTEDDEDIAFEGEIMDLSGGMLTLTMGMEIRLMSTLGKRSSREMWLWIESDDTGDSFRFETDPVLPALVLV